jgi:Thioredoxin domain
VSGWWAAAFVVQWILVAVLAIVVVALARQIGVLQLRLAPLGALEIDDEGPTLGEAPEARQVRTPEGSSRVIGGPGRGRLVAFVSDTCPICEQVAPSLPAAADASGLELQVVSNPELEAAYGVPGVPFVVVLDEVGVVRSKGTVNSLEQVEGLVDTARRRTMQAEELRAG